MLNAAQGDDLADEIRTEITDNQIQLPTLPEVALRVRDAVESESADAETIARMVANDAALSDVSYLRSTAEGRLTLPLLERARLLLRGRLGAINTERIGDVPATERFYAGGDQSVRGYGYKKLGPTEDGENVGCRYLAVGSIEADYLFAGNFGAAAFFDAGNADDDFPPDLKRGVGIGFRWRSPVGMARVDLAKALDEGEDFRIHISFGADL